MRTKAIPISVALSIYSSLSWSHNQPIQLESLIDLSLAQLQDVQINSATKISQSLNSIPANISIVTRNDIKAYGFTSFVELLRNIPGIFLEEDTEEVYIGTRGSIGGSVQLLVNGIPQHPSLQKGLTTVETNRLNIPVAAIDRIEFIRGPMAVIYGNNAFQGTLNVITHGTDDNSAKLAVGDNNNGEVFLRVNRAFDDGKIGVNFGASHDGRFSGDYRDQLGQDQLSSLNEFTQLTTEDNLEKSLKSVDIVAEWHNLSSTFSYQKSQYSFFPSLPPTDDNELMLETWTASLQYQFDINDQWHGKSLFIVSEDEYNLDDINIIDDQAFGFQYQQSRRVEFEQVLAYQNQQGTNALLGYRLQEISDASNRALVQSTPSTGAFIDLQLKDYQTHELFSQYQRSLSKHWSLVLGFRYSRLPNEYEFHNRSALGVSSINKLRTDNRDLYNYRLALLYTINDFHQFKLLHGSASQDNESSVFSEPESIRTTELVHKYNHDNWLLTQSIYYSTTRNILRRNVSFDMQIQQFIDRSINNGRWRSYGYDLTLDYQLIENWHVYASFNLQSTEDLTLDDNIGYSPNQLFKLRTDYQYKQHTLAFFGHFVGRRDSGFNLEDTDNDQEPDTLLRGGLATESYWNLGVNWRFDFSNQAAINLNISNLLDTEYRYPENEVSDLERGLIGVGRVVTLSAEYSW